jgi:hypothetical protein
MSLEQSQMYREKYVELKKKVTDKAPIVNTKETTPNNDGQLTIWSRDQMAGTFNLKEALLSLSIVTENKDVIKELEQYYKAYDMAKSTISEDLEQGKLIMKIIKEIKNCNVKSGLMGLMSKPVLKPECVTTMKEVKEDLVKMLTNYPNISDFGRIKAEKMSNKINVKVNNCNIKTNSESHRTGKVNAVDANKLKVLHMIHRKVRLFAYYYPNETLINSY